MDLSLGVLLFLVFIPVSSSPVNQTSYSAYTSAEARDLHRTYQVRLVALSCSCLSLTASLLAFYWFSRMDKLFRHRLIMLLIYGDLTRATWYFVFAVYSLARGTVKTETHFCQSSGFFIQYGAETSDYAVLVMAVHTALQVFRPVTQCTSDGLYQYRYYVYLGGLVLPGMMASLAFINPGPAYLSQGAFCTLPIRPFWYRLALAWIPRYLIALIIIGLAIAIYAYVGFEFRSYANMSRSINTSMTTTLSRASYTDRGTEPMAGIPQMAEQVAEQSRRVSSITHDILSSQRRASLVTPMSEKTSPNHLTPGTETCTRSLPGSSSNLALNRPMTARPPLFVIPSGHTIKTSPSTANLNSLLSPTIYHDPNPLSSSVPAPEQDLAPSHEASVNSPTVRHLARQRRHIHRQLRLMFIYPLVYTLMWLVPLIQHCMMYNDDFARHPLWFFRIGATICVTSVGFVDCLIFSLREKPWRNIHTSDGTFWGSFSVWHFRRPSNAGLANVSVCGSDSRRGTTGSERSSPDGDRESRIAHIKSSVRTSAGDDFTRVAAEQARVQLEMERDERLAALMAKVAKRREIVDEVGSEEYGSEESCYMRQGEEDGRRD